MERWLSDSGMVPRIYRTDGTEEPEYSLLEDLSPP